MQPGNPGPGQDPYQQNPYQDPYQQQYPPGYGQVPQYNDPFTPQSGVPYAPDSPPQPAEYSLYPPPQVPQYPAGGYSVPPMAPMPMAHSGQGNTFGLLSMIFGIVAFPLLCCFYLGVPLAIAAIVLGIIGVGRANQGTADNKGMSIAGIACGGTAPLLGVGWVVAVFGFGAPNYP
ncbi:MAG: hypothetical protein AUI14_09120 [Actinobacteria bacterium 13_2_20CM_2_71_6]|nr:MAG: hypothetical protein AUI14_09120 [Actinobacteria bacterium 13_2_20CM_2_71_6]